VAAQSWRAKLVSGPDLHLELPPRLAAGGRFLALLLLDLPLAVVGMASVGIAQWVSGLFAGAWFILVLNALYNRWFTVALPIASGAFLIVVILALPFNSPAFIVDFWTTALLFLLSLPRQSR
jgi:hypothetical protein